MTAALGWTLALSKRLLRPLVEDVCGHIPEQIDEAVIQLQTARGPGGITDVEIAIGKDLLIVIEAKRGLMLPTTRQLDKYAGFLSGSEVKERHLVALTNASAASAGMDLRCAYIEKDRLHHRSWQEIRGLAEHAAQSTASSIAKLWLRTFSNYVRGILGMEHKYSNKVFVVSLGGKAEGWSVPFRDIVEKNGRYFFPVGNRWPDPPPNYLGFRYDGRLQSIHQVKSYVTFTRPSDLFAEAPKKQEWPLHYCVTLGPAIRPPHPVLNGPRIKMSNRVYCLLDTLLTNNTISDALTETESRERSTE